MFNFYSLDKCIVDYFKKYFLCVAILWKTYFGYLSVRGAWSVISHDLPSPKFFSVGHLPRSVLTSFLPSVGPKHVEPGELNAGFNGIILPVVSVSNTTYCRTNSLRVSTVPVPVLKIPTVVSREHRLTFCTNQRPMLLLQVCNDDQPLYGLLQLRTVNLKIFLCLLRFPGEDA